MLKNLFWHMKVTHLFPGKTKIPGMGGREGEQAQDLLPGSEGKAPTLPGFVPGEAQQLPAERAFCIFGSCILGFAGCGAALGGSALPDSPTSTLDFPPAHRALLTAKLCSCSCIQGNFKMEIYSHSSGTGSALFTFTVTKFFTSETLQLQLP